MRPKNIEPVTIKVPSLGQCTLIPLHHLQEHYSSYLSAKKTAQELGLKELNSLDHDTIQKIYLELAKMFLEEGIGPSTAVSVYLSHVHESYLEISTLEDSRTPHPSITSLEIFFLEMGGPIEMTTCEVGIDEERGLESDDRLYVLFLEEE
jgi:hypothetical protein